MYKIYTGFIFRNVLRWFAIARAIPVRTHTRTHSVRTLEKFVHEMRVYETKNHVPHFLSPLFLYMKLFEVEKQARNNR